jgi:hypothetical protein
MEVGMKYCALALLGLTALVAAQTAPIMQGKPLERRQTADQLHEKLQIALNDNSADAERARNAAYEFKHQMESESPEESREADGRYKAQIRERLQNAINLLETSSGKVKAQVQMVQERIQSRLQERKNEISQHEHQRHALTQN